MIGMPVGLVTLNSNLLSVVDTETTGLVDGYHDLIQVAVVPLNQDLDPADCSPFYMNIRPEHPERAAKGAMEKNGLSLEMLMNCPSRWAAADIFDDWFENLGLPRNKKLVWLTHNGPHDIPFMRTWLGEAGFQKYFYFQGRDSMFYAISLNDAAAYKCQPVPFPEVSLKGMAKKFGIVNDNAHDALSDCLTTGKVYRELLRWEG